MNIYNVVHSGTLTNCYNRSYLFVIYSWFDIKYFTSQDNIVTFQIKVWKEKLNINISIKKKKTG